MNERLAVRALLVAMLAVGAIAWWFQLRPDLEVDAARLDAFPFELADWEGEAIPLEDGVERILRADHNLQRVYARPFFEDLVWLYVGYYGTRRGGRPEHTPEVCYPSAGWTIESRRRADVGRGDEVNELVVSLDGHRRLVHYWYMSSRSRALLGTWSVSLDQLRGRLSDGRADGALVRLSTPIETDADRDAARLRLLAFRAPLLAELESRWPEERARE